MATSNFRTLKDTGGALRFLGKNIRMKGSSHFVQEGFALDDHFGDTSGVGTLAVAAGTKTGTKFTSVATGTGTQTSSILTNTRGGVLSLKGPAFADQRYELFGNILWFEPDDVTTATPYKLMFEARVKMPTVITGNATLFGIVDATPAIAGVTGTLFALDSTSTLTAGTSDAAGFVYSSVPTSGVLDIAGTTTNYLGVATITGGSTHKNIYSSAVAADTSWHTFNITVQPSGDADFYIDTVLVKHVQYVATTSGVKPSIAFTPYINFSGTTTAAYEIQVDYIKCAGWYAP